MRREAASHNRASSVSVVTESLRLLILVVLVAIIGCVLVNAVGIGGDIGCVLRHIFIAWQTTE